MLPIPEIIAERGKSGTRMRRASSVRYSLTAKEEIRQMMSDGGNVSPNIRQVLSLYSEIPDKVLSLDLSNKSFTDADLQPLAQLINVVHNIQTIDLSFNSLTFSEGVLRSKALPRKHGKVKRLLLTRNLLGDGKASRMLRGFLQCFGNLEELDMSGCGIRDVDMHVLVLTFLSLRKLRKLSLARNHITDFGMMGLAKVMEENNELQMVDISHNEVTQRCWRHLRPHKGKIESEVPDPCHCAVI